MAMDDLFKVAEVIADTRRAFDRIKSLEESQAESLKIIERLDARVRELEARRREDRAEILLEALKESQQMVGAVQGGFYQELKEMAVALDRINRHALTGDGAGADGLLADGQEKTD